MPEDYLLENGYDFGWGPFVAASRKAKEYYAALALMNNLMDLSKDVRDSVLRDWVGLVPHADYGYIDHQSIPVFPMEYTARFAGRGISKEYFMDYRHWLLNERLVIQGGNDNGEEDERHLQGNRINEPFLTDMGHSAFVVRKDPKGFYTIFNKENGTKVRMTFDDSIDMSKGTTPELVDLKITDWCDHGCAYCYQGSTPKGAHADNDYIKYTVLRALAQLQVLEVAIGGGEPTAHPDFWSILREAASLGIKPSFSTRQLGWMEDPFNLRIFKETCGAFAFSVDSFQDTMRLVRAVIKYDLDERVTIQYVPEANTYSDTKAVMEVAAMHSIPVTLLGYKKTGRGTQYLHKLISECRTNDITPEQWKVLLEMEGQISVDTVFAATHQQMLKDAGVADWSYKIKEGAHSMYIDAVTHELAKSSFTVPSERLVVHSRLNSDDLVFEIKEAFKEYGCEQQTNQTV
jgi:organic radical activating enzyme